MSYTQLTQEQRYQIHSLLKMDHNQTEIAVCLGVHKSTISRELRRYMGLRGYRPKQAHQKAMSRRNQVRNRIIPETWAVIEAKIRLEWSPEQIFEWLKIHLAIQINHGWIYQYILAYKHAGGTMYRHLRCQKNCRTAMAVMNVEGSCQTGYALKSDQQSSTNVNGSTIGKWIQSLAKGIVEPSFP